MKYRIKDNNQFWTHYLSLEKELQEIGEYVSIHERNLSVFSFKIMQLYFAVCTDIDSIFKHIQSNLGFEKPKDNSSTFNIKHHIRMLNDNFPLVRNTIVELKFSGQVLEFNPFEPLFLQYIKPDEDEHYNILFLNKIYRALLQKDTWWKDYNSVKHSRSDKFHKANLDNLLHSLSALHILNLVYHVSLYREGVKNYNSIAIEAPALYHYPFFQLKNAFCNKYPSEPYDFYVSNLNNKAMINDWGLMIGD